MAGPLIMVLAIIFVTFIVVILWGVISDYMIDYLDGAGLTGAVAYIAGMVPLFSLVGFSVAAYFIIVRINNLLE